MLRDMTVEMVNEIVVSAAASDRVVLHFHGGLVSEKRGRAVAADLLPVYRDAGAYPVFFVWRSGLLEVLRGKLRKTPARTPSRHFEKLVLKFVIGNVLGAEAASAGSSSGGARGGQGTGPPPAR